MKLHLHSVIPVATAAVGVGLGIALLTASGFAPNSGVDNSWLTLNTSRAGQSTVKISTVNGSGSNDPGSLTGILDGLLGGLVNNLTNTVNSQFQDLQGELIGNVTRAVGLKDAYLLFVSHACEGNFFNSNDTNSLINVTKCYSYRDKAQGLRRIANQIPSSFVVGNTNISVPLIGVLGTTLGSLVDLATQGSTFMQAMLIVGVVASGLVMLGSLAFVVGPRKHPIAIGWLVLAGLGSTAFWVFAVAATAVALATTNLINGGGGEALGVHARTGSRFVGMGWAAAVVTTLGVVHWWVVWFVEFRRHSYKKRTRTASQIGNYRNIVREVREDRTIREAVPGSKEEADIMGSQPVMGGARRTGMI